MVTTLLERHFPRWVASLRGTMLLYHEDLGVKTMSIVGRVTTTPLVSCPSWRHRIRSPSQLVVVVVLVGWWSCSCAATEEVHKVRVGREVQRGHGSRQSWVGAHGSVVIPTMAWCR
jgi:hypothetical protein